GDVLGGERPERTPELGLRRQEHLADAVVLGVADAEAADEALELATGLVQRDADHGGVVGVDRLHRQGDRLPRPPPLLPPASPPPPRKNAPPSGPPTGSTTIADSIGPGNMSNAAGSSFGF